MTTRAELVQKKHLDIRYRRHHDVYMRTTLTLEPDVADRVRQEIRRTGRTMKAVINDGLRRGLGLEPAPVAAPRFRVDAQPLGQRAGVDLDRMNQLLDQLDAGHAAGKARG